MRRKKKDRYLVFEKALQLLVPPPLLLELLQRSLLLDADRGQLFQQRLNALLELQSGTIDGNGGWHG